MDGQRTYTVTRGSKNCPIRNSECRRKSCTQYEEITEKCSSVLLADAVGRIAKVLEIQDIIGGTSGEMRRRQLQEHPGLQQQDYKDR